MSWSLISLAFGMVTVVNGFPLCRSAPKKQFKMKTLKFAAFYLCFFAVTTLFTSCQKDDDGNTPESQQTLVGQWNVDEGTAVAFVDGNQAFEGNITTEGTMTFNNNKTGSANFSMTFLNDTESVNGTFTWEKDGFEILFDKDTEDESRWAIIDDEKNRQRLQFTDVDEESLALGNYKLGSAAFYFLYHLIWLGLMA